MHWLNWTMFNPTPPPPTPKIERKNKIPYFVSFHCRQSINILSFMWVIIIVKSYLSRSIHDILMNTYLGTICFNHLGFPPCRKHKKSLFSLLHGEEADAFAIWLRLFYSHAVYTIFSSLRKLGIFYDETWWYLLSELLWYALKSRAPQFPYRENLKKCQVTKWGRFFVLFFFFSVGLGIYIRMLCLQYWYSIKMGGFRVEILNKSVHC